MKISTRGRYALRMMLDLAENQGDGVVALKDIAQRDGISCECGSHQWRLEVHYASVELICAQCGSAMRINAGTMDDLNELCCHPKLTIRSSPA